MKKTTRAGIRTFFGVSDDCISKWRAQGLPSDGSKYDMPDVCHWVDITPRLSTKHKIKARKFLSDHQAKKKTEADKSDAPKPKKIALGKKGIKEAVERLRTEEVEAHARYSRARSEHDPEAATLLDEWRDSCEFLSKAEPSLLKFLKECGEVAPVSEFEKYMAKTLQAIKSAFLALPSKLAPTLEGLEWPKIQKILEAEVEGALVKLSS